MALRKTTAINLRMTPEMKDLLRLAADREHRTLSNMIESLILGYCQMHEIDVAARSTKQPARQQRPKKRTAGSA